MAANILHISFSPEDHSSASNSLNDFCFRYLVRIDLENILRNDDHISQLARLDRATLRARSAASQVTTIGT